MGYRSDVLVTNRFGSQTDLISVLGLLFNIPCVLGKIIYLLWTLVSLSVKQG